VVRFDSEAGASEAIQKGKVAMTTHKDWFGVDIEKRAARVRSHPVPHILKGALANSLNDPLGVESIGMILHECAHAAVSGHSIAFAEEVQRLGGKLAGWVGTNPERWADLRDRLYGNGQA